MTTRHFCDCCDVQLTTQNTPARTTTLEHNMIRIEGKFTGWVTLTIDIKRPEHLCTDCLWRTIRRGDPTPKEIT